MLEYILKLVKNLNAAAINFPNCSRYIVTNYYEHLESHFRASAICFLFELEWNIDGLFEDLPKSLRLSIGQRSLSKK